MKPMEIFNPPVRYRWRPLPEEIQKAQMTTCAIYTYEQNRMLAEKEISIIRLHEVDGHRTSGALLTESTNLGSGRSLWIPIELMQRIP